MGKNWKIKDPNYQQRIKESFHRQQFMQYIGASLTALGPGTCEIRLPYKKELTQQHGFFHAGIVGTLADNAGGYAAYTLMNATSSILSVEFKLNLLAPADGQLLIGRSEVIKAGNTLTICRSDVFSVNGDVEKHCAACQMTLFELKDRSDL